VAGSLELSDDGKAMKYFQLVPFDVQINPRVITRAAATLPAAESDKEA
jgi:hypothetical protein